MADSSLEFDPTKPFENVSPPPGEFDPTKPFENVAPENPHDFGPTIKRVGSGMWEGAKQAIGGIANAVMNPGQAASEAVDSLTSSPIDYAQGIDRTVRNIPILGGAVDHIVQDVRGLGGLISGGPQGAEQAVENYKTAQAASDAQHATEHPLTDFIQKSAGLAALPQNIIGAASSLAIDAFSKSIDAGNSVSDALKDARNAGLLSATAMKTGQWLGKKTGVIPGDSLAPETSAEPEGPIPNFPTQPQLRHSLYAEPLPKGEPPLPVPPPASASSPSGGNLGKVLGGMVGGIGGAIKAGIPGGVTGSIAGGIIGEKIGNLASKFGSEAVQKVQNLGIPIDKLANSTYLAPIMSAAQQGPQSLAIAHFVMSQKDPGYQAIAADSK